MLLSLVGAPAYGRGGGHGGGGHGGFSGGGHAGVSGGARGGSTARGYSGAGISRWYRQLWREVLLIRNLNGTLRQLRAKVLRTANLDWNADLWFKCEVTK